MPKKYKYKPEAATNRRAKLRARGEGPEVEVDSPILRLGGRTYDDATLERAAINNSAAKLRNAHANSKIRGAAARFTMNLHLEGLSPSEIRDALAGPPHHLSVTPTNIQTCLRHNYPLLRELALNELRLQLFSGLAAKSRRIAALIQQYDEITAALNAPDGQDGQDEPLLDSRVRVQLFTERRKTIAAIQGEVDPIVNPSVTTTIHAGVITHRHILDQQEHIDTVAEVIDVAHSQDIPAEAKDGLARALAALTAGDGAAAGAGN